MFENIFKNIKFNFHTLFPIHEVLQTMIFVFLIGVFSMSMVLSNAQPNDTLQISSVATSVAQAINSTNIQRNTDDIHAISSKLEKLQNQLEQLRSEANAIKTFGIIAAALLAFLKFVGFKFNIAPSSKEDDKP